ncbi:MAG TPA: hypothetical protein IAA77_06770 [Candidatus Avibacteroides excrementipullorum]|nr:hypothetical protein [Candidatus Avibacteroides excrementipullorum]
MKKQHLSYLRRTIGLAAAVKGGARLLELVSRIKCAKTPVYQLIRDIVCDSRYYSVVEGDLFWKNYSLTVISHFIDSLTDNDWQDEERCTGKKEDFLNDWLSKYLFPISDDEKKNIMEALSLTNELRKDMKFSEDEEVKDFGIQPGKELEIGISDMTNSQSLQGEDLPDEMKEYMLNTQSNAQGIEAESHEVEAAYLKRLDPAIVELAKRIGRRGGIVQEYVGRFQTASRSDICGVTIGNNLNSLLPTELAMLGNRATENIFYHRYVQNRLQLFSSASSSVKGKKDKAGPIYICVDTSGSMTGEPEVAAKTLALAIAIVAQRDKRPICMINYSNNLSFFILTNLHRQRQKFLSFLSLSYSGGNDENKLFNFIFTILPKQQKYRQFAEAFKGADLLVISDFEWSSISEANRKLIADSKAGGMNYYALGIDVRICDIDKLDDSDQEDMFYADGYQFFKECDFRYIFKEGKVTEYFDRAKVL